MSEKGGGCCLLQVRETNKPHVSLERLANLLPTFILQNRNDEYNFEREHRSYVSTSIPVVPNVFANIWQLIPVSHPDSSDPRIAIEIKGKVDS